MTELAYETAGNLARKLRRRELSCRELLEHFLARIERHNPALNAIVTPDFERARTAADAADAALARGAAVGPLHGVPMTLKDAFEVEGVRSTGGAQVWADHIGTHDACAVQRLRAAGAIFMGRTNVPAFCGDLQSYNPIFGTTNNPWNLTRTPGGSSGGAAAALAAGLTPIELGSDIGGSIRTPASWCGVFGHKPSFSIVPPFGHIPGAPGSVGAADLNVVGPMARSAEDLALLLGLVAGPLPEDAKAYSLRLPPPRAASLRGYRIAAWFDDPACPVASPVRTALEHAADTLRKAGAQIEPAKPAFEFADLHRTYRALLDPNTARALPEPILTGLRGVAQRGDASNPYYGIACNVLRPHHEWLEFSESRHKMRARCAEFFQDYDALLCPTTCMQAVAHDHGPLHLRTLNIDGQTRSYNDLFAWVALATACYLPASVIPIGVQEGLPVGMQIVGPRFEDYTTIDLAGRFSEVLGGFTPPPGY